MPPTSTDNADPVIAPAEEAAARAARIWAHARPATADHPYLAAKRAGPLGLRMDPGGRLIVPLQDIDGCLHSIEFIAPDGAKRFLAGGAKKGHFAVVGARPGPLSQPTGPVLICEGWATGASLYMATGHRVIAAMDAGKMVHLRLKNPPKAVGKYLDTLRAQELLATVNEIAPFDQFICRPTLL